MSKEKQIDVIADILCEAKGHDCNGGDDCRCVKQAEALYNAGYRKQSEGEWDEINKCNGAVATFVHGGGSGCGYVYRYYRHPRVNCLKSLPKFCPECGAKMKGGAE